MSSELLLKLRYPIILGLLLLFVFVHSVSAAGKPTTSQTHLSEAKLKACQLKEKVIKKRTESLVKMATNMLEKFGSIEKRVEDFYNARVAPSGKTVPNYNTLIVDIQTKKGIVNTKLTKVQSDSTSFTCVGNDPKGVLSQFKNDMRSVKSALKDYRTSIKNLILAVHSATGTTQRNTTVSPKPTKAGGSY